MSSEQTNDELARLGEWLADDHTAALATVVSTWGSSPRPVGSHLVINDQGEFLGSVSGGCIEGAVVAEALEVMDDGKPRILEFGVSDEEAWEVGLSCGGAIRVYVERAE
ncbi:MAG: XdhC family protein [Halioglobus sp.]